MNRMMITGGAGFIGANFVHYWRARHPKDVLVIVDAMTYAGNRSSIASALDEQCLLIEADINDSDLIMRLLREHKLNRIIHFAAESHVDRSIDGPDAFINANVLGTHSLLKAARQVWQIDGLAADNHRFHHVSTDEVYGSLEIDEPPFTEKTAYAPNSPYASSKAGSDFLVRAYHHTYGLDTTTSNCSNNYGPYQYPEKLIPLMLINLLTGKQLPVYGTGMNIRDWLYVDDHAQAVELIIEKGSSGQTYNVGGLNEWKNIDIVKTLCRLVQERFDQRPELSQRYPDCPAAANQPCDSMIQFVEDRAGHDFRYAIDASLISDELGFKPETTFEAGLAKTIDWFLDNENWWREVLSKG